MIHAYGREKLMVLYTIGVKPSANGNDSTSLKKAISFVKSANHATNSWRMYQLLLWKQQ